MADEPKSINDIDGFDPETGLTAQRIKFAKFHVGMNGESSISLAESYKKAGYTLVYTYKRDKARYGKPLPDAEIGRRASRLAKIPGVDRYIKELREQIANESLDTAIAARTLIRLRDTADAREISGNRIGCCRYCWGKHNRYQRTVMEMQRDRETHETLLNSLLNSKDEKDQEKARRIGDFDEKGGIGYHERKKPNPKCGECFGNGVNRPYIADTDTLSPQAASIFRGIKQKADGSIEVVTDREGAPAIRAKLHGLLKDQVEHSGSVDVVSMTPEERQKKIDAIRAEAERRTRES